LAAGIFDKQSEGREKGDRGDMRAGFGARKNFRVLVEEIRHGFVAALAEEVSFADGLVGERRVEGN